MLFIEQPQHKWVRIVRLEFPGLCVAKGYICSIPHVPGYQAKLTRGIGTIGHVANKRIIHVQANLGAIGYSSEHVRHVQTFFDGSIASLEEGTGQVETAVNEIEVIRPIAGDGKIIELSCRLVDAKRKPAFITADDGHLYLKGEVAKGRDFGAWIATNDPWLCSGDVIGAICEATATPREGRLVPLIAFAGITQGVIEHQHSRRDLGRGSGGGNLDSGGRSSSCASRLQSSDRANRVLVKQGQRNGNAAHNDELSESKQQKISTCEKAWRAVNNGLTSSGVECSERRVKCWASGLCRRNGLQGRIERLGGRLSIAE